MAVDTAPIRKQRRRRAFALQRVRQGTLPLRQVLQDVPDALGTCPVWRVLLAAPTVGDKTVRRVCERARVWPLLALGELTQMQRNRLIDELPRRVH